MKLSEEAKLLVLLARPDGAELVRVGDHWACIWREGLTWWGALVHEVDIPAEKVWWTATSSAALRRDVVRQLTAEAQR